MRVMRAAVTVPWDVVQDIAGAGASPGGTLASLRTVLDA